MNTEKTIDDFLGGRVKLIQPTIGYRATSDSVLAASAVPVQSGDTVLDVGMGTGIIPMCLNARVPDLKITGIEYQSDLAEIAKQNAVLNNCNLTIVTGDIMSKLPAVHGKQYQHVVTNPPFYTEFFERTNPQTAKAYREKVSVADWLRFCMRHIRAKGTFTLIHRTESLPIILPVLSEKLGALELFPIESKSGVSANRFIIRGVIGSRKAMTIRHPLIMHCSNGSRSETAESLLRQGLGIDDV